MPLADLGGGLAQTRRPAPLAQPPFVLPGYTPPPSTYRPAAAPRPSTGTTPAGPGGYLPPRAPAPAPLPAAPNPLPATPAQPAGSPYPAFDPNNLFNADPGVLQAQAFTNQSIAELDALLRSSRRAALVNFGDPTLTQSNLQGYSLDPTDVTASRTAYESGNATLARLDRQKQLERQAVVNKLAGRGLIRSGDLGYGLGQSALVAGNREYDARAKLTDYLANPDTYLGLFGQPSVQPAANPVLATGGFASPPIQSLYDTSTRKMNELFGF